MEIEELAQIIGNRVQQRRKIKNLTLEQLAAQAGISRRMLINVEKGQVNPSVATLLSLSDALGIGLPALVAVPQQKITKITPAGEGAVLWQGQFGGKGILVAGTEPPQVVELWDWTLEPQEKHESKAHAAGTKELLQVMEGEIIITVAEEEHELKTGDAITFMGDLPHAYANPSKFRARFALTVFEPDVGNAE